jgi:hypothetical protein
LLSLRTFHESFIRSFTRRWHRRLRVKAAKGDGSWKEVSPQVKSRLVAAVRLALLELESLTRDRAQSRQYFAQPGEAEWGC